MKIVLVTGAGSGIGLALSTVCLKKGFTVIMVDKNTRKLHEEKIKLKQFYPAVITKTCDLTKASDVRKLREFIFKKFNHIDWIFNNAGIIGSLAPIWELSPPQVEAAFAVNVSGIINILKEFIPFLLVQKKPSHIINMASLYAVCASTQVGLYSMTKHAVLALSESLYYDLSALTKLITVSVVFPSFTNTSLLSTNNESSFLQHTLNSLMTHSKSAIEQAWQIIAEVEQKKFYIFPDKEVKDYAKMRTTTMLGEKEPALHPVEKLMDSLVKRAKKQQEKS